MSTVFTAGMTDLLYITKAMSGDAELSWRSPHDAGNGKTVAFFPHVPCVVKVSLALYGDG